MKKKATPSSAIFAAGGVVMDSKGRVAVIHRPRYNDWCLPKGKLKKGEDLLVAAVREVWEETCCLATPEEFLGSLCYTVKGKPKWVFYWHMRVDTLLPFKPCAEVDQLEWLSLSAAARRLEHRGEREMLARASGRK
ncbi:MAG: NUDIX hydrolase [Planctomycetota bacterium]|nr:NUDIX hydrolase [Planctomycetota bacterium]